MRRLLRAALLGLALLALLGCTNTENVEKVKNSGLGNYLPGVKIGQLVDEFFVDPRWSTGTAKPAPITGFPLVAVTGKLRTADGEIPARLEFVGNKGKDGPDFVFWKIDAGGKVYNELYLVGLYDAKHPRPDGLPSS